MNLWYTFVWFKIRNNTQSLNSVVIDLQIIVKKNQYIFYFSFDFVFSNWKHYHNFWKIIFFISLFNQKKLENIFSCFNFTIN